MNFVNLTPHSITVVALSGDAKIFPPSGQVARVATSVDSSNFSGFRINFTVFGDVTGIPEAEAGTVFITSTLVAQAIKRPDVVSPDTGPDSIRENGQVKAVRGFQRF